MTRQRHDQQTKDFDEPKTLTFLTLEQMFEYEFETTQPTNSPVCDDILYMHVFFFVFGNYPAVAFAKYIQRSWEIYVNRYFFWDAAILFTTCILLQNWKRKNLSINRKNVVPNIAEWSNKTTQILGTEENYSKFVSFGFQDKHFVARSVALAQCEWTKQ